MWSASVASDWKGPDVVLVAMVGGAYGDGLSRPVAETIRVVKVVYAEWARAATDLLIKSNPLLTTGPRQASAAG